MKTAIRSTLMIAATASFASAARAQDASPGAVGAAISQWTILNCPSVRLPQSVIETLPSYLAFLPQVDRERGYARVEGMVNALGGRDAACASFGLIIANEFGPAS